MFAAVYIPDFELQAALRVDPDLRARPVALVRETDSTITQLTDAARSAGVHPGLTATQAMARCPNLLIKARAPAQEQSAGDLLLQTAFCFSPAVEATAPGVCTLDLKGLSHARDSTRNIIQALARFHLEAQVGLADNPLLAWHAARQARPFLIVNDAQQFLAELPIDTIDPSPGIRSILGKWGIRTLGAFLALGKDAVAERLGPEAVELFERAAARASRPLRCVQPPELFEETIDFENPVEFLEPLLFILRRFLDQITQRLDLSYRVVEQLHLRLVLSDGTHYERRFSIPAPTNRVDTLFRMLHTHLENVRTDSPIVRLQLEAKPCRAQSQQFGLFETALRDPNQFYETLARLTAWLGPDRVGIAEMQPTHRPDAFRLKPVSLDENANRAMPAAAAATRASHSSGGANTPCAPASGTRQPIGLSLRRFRPPISAEVRFEQNRPVWLKTPQLAARIVAAQGPWHRSGDWWDQSFWQREEWDIQTASGGLYRMYQQNNQWFLEAEYD